MSLSPEPSRASFSSEFAPSYGLSPVEPTKPLTREVEAVFVERVDAGAAALLLARQAGVFEDAQVPRRRRSLVFEASGDLARGRDPAA
jgi:hypothetical protein